MVVALVPVAFTNVKFWRVVEPVARRFANARVPVAVMFAAKRLPEKRPLPCTESVWEGVVVPIPTFPLATTFNALDPTLRSDAKRFVELAVVEKSEVVVAAVPVALRNVKF